MPNDNSANAAALAHVTGSAIDAASVAQLNKRQRKFAIDMWNMQNEYNTPAMQMQRFKDAGLNPNLIYGQGNAGNAGAVATPELRAPEFGKAISGAIPAGLQALTEFTNVDMKIAQTDNLKAQQLVLQNEAMLKAAQTYDTLTSGDRKKFDLDQEILLKDVSADFRRESLRQLRTNIQLSINKDAREAAATSQSIEESFNRILNMQVVREKDAEEIQRIKQNIQILKQQGVLNQIEINLRKAGINPNSGVWEKAVGAILSNSIKADFSKEDIQQLGKKIKDGIWNWITDFQ